MSLRPKDVSSVNKNNKHSFSETGTRISNPFRIYLPIIRLIRSFTFPTVCPESLVVTNGGVGLTVQSQRESSVYTDP